MLQSRHDVALPSIPQAESQIGQQNLDEYEAEAGFVLRFVDLDEAIRVNLAYTSEDYFNEIMIKREAKVLQMIKNKGKF